MSASGTIPSVGNIEEDRSPGGSAILRHQAVERDFTAAAPGLFTEAIEAHLARWFGDPATVFHEIISDLVHIDVHMIEPAPERPYWTLATTGMSDLPMTVPPGAEAFSRAELLLFLPPVWKIPTGDDDRWYWPIRELKKMARLPHEYASWLGMGHTVPNGDPPTPFRPETRLCGWWLLPPLGVPPEAWQVETASEERVHLWVLNALHADEMELKLASGSDALIDRFDAANVAQVLDPARPSVIVREKKGLFSRFHR